MKIHKSKYWTTKEGVKIKIKELENEHLANIVSMLFRKLVKWKFNMIRSMTYYAEGAPDIASLSVVGECANLMMEDEQSLLQEYYPIIYKEAVKRKLIKPGF